MSRADVMKELSTLALNHPEASWAIELMRTGQPIEVALMTLFKHCLAVNKQLRDTVEKYVAGTVPPVVIQFPGTVQEFIELHNSTMKSKGERNEGFEGTE